VACKIAEAHRKREPTAVNLALALLLGYAGGRNYYGVSSAEGPSSQKADFLGKSNLTIGGGEFTVIERNSIVNRSSDKFNSLNSNDRTWWTW